jgi:hypothetical protein
VSGRRNRPRFVLPEAGEHDVPQGVVRVPVAADVEPDAIVAFAGVRGHGRDAADLGPRGFVADPSGVVTGTSWFPRQDVLLALSEAEEDFLSELDSQYYGLEESLDLDEVMRRLGGPA